MLQTWHMPQEHALNESAAGQVKIQLELIRAWDIRMWPDVYTYRLIWLLIYHSNTHLYFQSGIFSKQITSVTYMDLGLWKVPCVSFRISSINYYLVCSLQIHKICALCSIFRVISVLVMTKNSNGLQIRVPGASRFGMWQSQEKFAFVECEFHITNPSNANLIIR